MSKTGLGRGLSALIPTNDYLNKEDPVTEIEVGFIQPNTYQPRRTFDQEKLQELAQSIQEHGVVQPVVVRPLPSGKYELVVGERRLRACQLLGLEKIPAVAKELTNEQMMEIALVENIQREDLNPVEEAYAYKKLVEEFGLTQEQVAQKVSKSRSLVANMLRLLNLPAAILERISTEQLTVGHVRPVLAIEDEALQLSVAQEILDKDLSVRESEHLVKKIKQEGLLKKSKTREKRLPPNLVDIESKLRGLCGTKVAIKDSDGKGKIEIDYYSSEDLDRIISIILKEAEF